MFSGSPRPAGGSITDSPRLRLRLALRPRDGLRLPRSAITDSPRLRLRLALPLRGGFEGLAIPGGLGERDGADRRQRDAGVPVGGDVGAPGGGVTDGAERG